MLSDSNLQKPFNRARRASSSSMDAPSSEGQVRRFSISSLKSKDSESNQSGLAAAIASGVRRLSAVDITPPKIFQGGIFSSTATVENDEEIANTDRKASNMTTKTKITVTKVNGEVERGTSSISSDQSTLSTEEEEPCPDCGNVTCLCDDPYYTDKNKTSGCFQFFNSVFGFKTMFTFVTKSQQSESQQKVDGGELAMLSNIKGPTDSESESDSDVTEDELLPEIETLSVLSPPPRRESVIDKMIDQISVIARKVSATPNEMAGSTSPLTPAKLPATIEVRKLSGAGNSRGHYEDFIDSDNTSTGTPKTKKKGLRNKLTKKLSNKSIKRMGSLKRTEKPKK